MFSLSSQLPKPTSSISPNLQINQNPISHFSFSTTISSPPPAMGCCVSTKTSSPRQSTAASTLLNGGSKSPPPIDEETVKEVLSETKLPPPPIPGLLGSGRMAHQNGVAAAFGEDDHPHSAHSESFSTESDDAFRWPRFDGRPFPSEVKREKTAGRSPARRSDSSPGRVKSGPVSLKKGVDAKRKTGGSGESIRKWEEEKEREEMRRPPTTGNDLLENSLVSLECFIFL